MADTCLRGLGDRAGVRTGRFAKRRYTVRVRSGGTVDSVLEKIADDPMFAAWFAKETITQCNHHKAKPAWCLPCHQSRIRRPAV